MQIKQQEPLSHRSGVANQRRRRPPARTPFSLICERADVTTNATHPDLLIMDCEFSSVCQCLWLRLRTHKPAVGWITCRVADVSAPTVLIQPLLRSFKKKRHTGRGSAAYSHGWVPPPPTPLCVNHVGRIIGRSRN
jgi:hypothetical protein